MGLKKKKRSKRIFFKMVKNMADWTATEYRNLWVFIMLGLLLLTVVFGLMLLMWTICGKKWYIQNRVIQYGQPARPALVSSGILNSLSDLENDENDENDFN